MEASHVVGRLTAGDTESQGKQDEAMQKFIDIYVEVWTRALHADGTPNCLRRPLAL